MQYFQRKFAVTSVIKIYSKICELCKLLTWPFLYSINLKKCQIQATWQHFHGSNNPFSIKSTVVWIKISEKNISLSGLKYGYYRLANREKHVFPLIKDFKLWRTWSLAVPAHNFLSNLQFFKVGKTMVSKYEYLILPGAFPHKVTPYIDFTDESVVQSGNTCKVPVIEILL